MRWKKPVFFSGESGDIHVIVWMRVSDWPLQVCSIPHSRPVFTKVCQRVWREPIPTDMYTGVFPYMHSSERTESLSGRCKNEQKNSPPARCHACMIMYDLWNGRGHMTVMCLYTRPDETTVCFSPLKIIPVCSQVAPLLLLELFV